MIHVIGDSHIMSFDALPFIRHFIGGKDGGATAYGLGKESSSTNSRNKVVDICRGLKAGETIILCFGEVDCRVHIFKQWLRTHDVVYTEETINWAGIDKKIDDAVINYGNLITEVQKMRPDLFVLSIPPTRADINENEYPAMGSREVRTKITLKMNHKLKQFCKENGTGFIDIYFKITDSSGVMLKEYVRDEIHYNNKVMPLVLAEIVKEEI